MEVEIWDRRENPLLSRTEIRFRVHHEGEVTPKREAVREKLGSMLNTPKERVVIDSMKTAYGMSEATGYAKVYSNKDDVTKVERRSLLVRHKLAEKKVKAAKAAPGTPPAGPPKPK